ncbi:transforming growth factor beta regulator 1 isoform X2 [Neocloeon triangulifer]|uniref:transforming growth factor beta regulator 1 isoform X2 n=1 Tax=Neocloeon triangulifer TaxID=2078957 RepID=UPI00286F39E7|nr:transforming growth factor beta regulator 1 isoform X2 [Neocloeon triangulifer]
MSLEIKKYKRKYEKTKKFVKSLVFENAALCDEISDLQEKYMVINEENKFLYSKLESFNSLNADGSRAASNPKTTPVPKNLPAPAASSAQKKTPAQKRSRTSSSAASPVVPEVQAKKGGRKSATARGKVVKKLVHPIQLDGTGRPIFPIDVGNLSVYSLGDVITDRSGYHTEEMIFPVGFCSCRVYGSILNPEQQCIYTCKILDNGPYPIFEIAADNILANPIVGSSPSDCLATLQSRINKAVGVEVVKADGLKGPEFFGITVPTIQNLIQSSGTRKLPGYRILKFEVCKTGNVEDPSLNDASLNFDALQRSIAFSKTQLASINFDSHSPVIRDFFMGI